MMLDKNVGKKWFKLLDESDTEFRDRIKSHFMPRDCINEDYEEWNCVRKWTYYYSDGTKETVTVRKYAL